MAQPSIIKTSGSGPVVLDKIIAKIDNQIILKSELEFAVAQLKASGEEYEGDLPCQFLESMVLNKLLLARAEIDSVKIENAVVQGELDRRMNYFITQVGSAEKLEQYYGKTIKQLKEELKREVRNQMLIQRMQEGITANVQVTPLKVRRYFNSIPTDSLPYFSTEVEVGQIVKLAPVSKVQKAQAREKLEALRQRVLAGESFQDLAKQFSEDPVSARQGGELGFFKKRELVPEYEATALKLEPGQTSQVIESQFGFHLIQLIERRGEEYNSRHILIKPGTSDIDAAAAMQYLDSLRTRILLDSISFAKAAKEYSDDKMTSGNGGLLQDGRSGYTRIPLDKIDPVIFFTIDTMQVGSISKPLPYRTEDGKEASRILYLKTRIAPHQANLKDDYQKIAAAALNEEKSKAVDEWFLKNKNSVYLEIDPAYSHCPILQSPQN